MSFPPRSKAQVSRSGDPLTFRPRLVAAWEKNPSMTVNEAMRETGASRAIANKVRRDLVARGLLKAGKERIL